MKEVRPLIGIPAVPTYDDEQDAIMALYQDYKDVVYQNGGIPFLINPIAKEDYVNTRLRNMKFNNRRKRIILRNDRYVCWYNHSGRV